MEMSAVSKAMFIGIMLLAVLLEVTGDLFFKKWALNENFEHLHIGLFLYFLGSVFWAMSLRYETLSRAIFVFVILMLIAGTLVGVFYFNETLSTANKFGILLGLLSLILIELF